MLAQAPIDLPASQKSIIKHEGTVLLIGKDFFCRRVLLKSSQILYRQVKIDQRRPSDLIS